MSGSSTESDLGLAIEFSVFSKRLSVENRVLHKPVKRKQVKESR